VSEQDLGDVAEKLEHKSAAFAELLAPERVGALTEEQAMSLLRSVFSSRRRAAVLLGDLTLPGFVGLVEELLHGPGPADERLARFHGRIAGVGRDVHSSVGFDLASELLHFTNPERHWLWTRWMWDPDTGKGALPLIVMDEVDIGGVDTADTYRRIGVAMAFVDDVGSAAGFKGEGHGIFDTDVFLAAVYAVYMYTTLRIRMTQEFAKIMPELDELVARLLGVHRSPLLEGRAA
jgi:hypothetical protein